MDLRVSVLHISFHFISFCFVLFCFVMLLLFHLFFRAQHNPHAMVVVPRVLRCSLHGGRHLQLRDQNIIGAPTWRQSCAWQAHTPHRPSPAVAPLHYLLRSNSHPNINKLSQKNTTSAAGAAIQIFLNSSRSSSWSSGKRTAMANTCTQTHSLGSDGEAK